MSNTLNKKATVSYLKKVANLHTDATMKDVRACSATRHHAKTELAETIIAKIKFGDNTDG